MILYHPAYDIHHCSYRILNVLSNLPNYSVNEEVLKLIDFYYLYPHFLKRITNLPRPFNSKKALINSIPEPFEVTPNQKSLFYELNILQESSVSTLAKKSILSVEEGLIKLNFDILPCLLKEKIEMDSFSKTKTFKMLIECFPKVNLNGVNGFKSRSGLMEYRYG